MARVITMELIEFDGITVVCPSHDTQRAYNDIMWSIRGIDVNDIIRESPAFTDTEKDN